MWQGFVFANFDPQAAPLGPTMQKADKILANYHLEDMVSTHHKTLQAMPFNWKLMVENFMEGYHNDRLHHDLYDLSRGDDPKRESITKGHIGFTFDDTDGVLIGTARTAFKNRGLNPTQRGLFPPVDTLTDDEHWQMVYMFVPPNLLVGLSTDSAFWFLVHPKGPERTTLQMSYIHPPSTREMKMFEFLFAAQVAGVKYFNDEDCRRTPPPRSGCDRGSRRVGALAKGDIVPRPVQPMAVRPVRPRGSAKRPQDDDTLQRRRRQDRAGSARCSKPTAGALFIAVDHAAYMGQGPPLPVVAEIASGQPDGLLATWHVARANAAALADVGLVLRVDGGISELGGFNSEGRVQPDRHASRTRSASARTRSWCSPSRGTGDEEVSLYRLARLVAECEASGCR